MRYKYEYVPPQSYEASVEGGTEALPPDNGGANEENGLGPFAIAIIAIAVVGVAGVGIAGIATVVAKSTAAAAVSSLPTTEYSSAQSENERIDRETRIRHEEMDRRLGPDDLEKQRTGTSAQDKIVREEMRKISEGEEKREYKERVMKKYGTDNEKVAFDAVQQERDSWAKAADAWRLSGNIATAGEVGATIVGAFANAAADVITQIPGFKWYRPVYRMATSIAGETAKEFSNKKTAWEAYQTGAIQKGLVRGSVKGAFEGARGFLKDPVNKGMTTFFGETLGEMAGAANEGGDIGAAGEKGMKNGVYNALTRAVVDKFATKSPIMNPPSSFFDKVNALSLLNNTEVHVKTVGGTVRKLAIPYII